MTSELAQFDLNSEQKMVQEMVRRLAQEKVAARAAAIDESAEYPQDMFDLLKQQGLFGLPFPAQYGGAGSILTACLAVEELGRVCYNTAYLLVVQWTTFGGILAAGSDEQKARLLPGLVSGELRAALSVTEPQAGSDVAGIQTRAEKVSGGYELTGNKIYCTNASVSDFFIVAAKTDPSLRHAGISAFIVERDTAGFQIGRHERKLGARGLPSCELSFDKAFVPEHNLLGEPGTGFSSNH